MGTGHTIRRTPPPGAGVFWSQMLARNTREARVERWLYHGLHGLDFPLWYGHRTIWRIGMIALNLRGAALSALGFCSGVRRRKPRVSSPWLATLFPGGASLLHPNAAAALGTPGLAALLLPQILPVFSVVAPCHPGAALRDLCHDPRGRDTSLTPRLWLVAAIVVSAGVWWTGTSVLAQGAGQAAGAEAHKAWMDDAADAQDELRDAIPARKGADAARAALKIEELLGKTETYWAGKHADDIVKLAKEVRALANQVADAARAARWTQAETAFGSMNGRCNACHDLHPEKR